MCLYLLTYITYFVTKEASNTVLSVFIIACISIHFGNFKGSERIFIKCGTVIVILQETPPLYFCSALYTNMTAV